MTIAAGLALALLACGVSLLTFFAGFGLGTLLMPAFALFVLRKRCSAVGVSVPYPIVWIVSIR